MPKPACIPCGRFFRPLKNGARIVECMPIGTAPSGKENAGQWIDYKIWMADTWRCDGCGTVIAMGYGQKRLAEHYEPGFRAEVERATIAMSGTLPRIYDC